MPADRNTRGPSVTGSIRNTRSNRRDSNASNSSLPDTTGFRPTSPLFRPTSPYSAGYPYGTITPVNSRPNSPFNRQNVTRNFRKSNSTNQTFTSLLGSGSPSLSTDSSVSNSMEVDPSTITWECATALVENQKVQSIYEKPVYSKTGQIISHGKVLTKTVTMTITTTIASTEILHPGEEGHQASMERYRKQQEEKQQQAPSQEDVKMETKSFPEAFSPQDTTEQDRRNLFQNNRLREQLRKANYYSPAPSPPHSPVPTKQE